MLQTLIPFRMLKRSTPSSDCCFGLLLMLLMPSLPNSPNPCVLSAIPSNWEISESIVLGTDSFSSVLDHCNSDRVFLIVPYRENSCPRCQRCKSRLNRWTQMFWMILEWSLLVCRSLSWNGTCSFRLAVNQHTRLSLRVCPF